LTRSRPRASPACLNANAPTLTLTSEKPYSGLSPALAALDARLDAKIRLDKAVDDELAPDNKGFNIEGPGSCAVVGAGEERGREIDVRTPPLAAIIL
jgi:hypothetical protein